MQHQNEAMYAPEMGAEYLNERQLAEQLGMSPRTLQGWRLKADHLPYYKVGRLVRYAENEVNEWLATRHCRHTSDATSKGLCNIQKVYGYQQDGAFNATDSSFPLLGQGSAE